MEYLDARRLTGPNVLWNRAGSILDVACTGEEADRFIPFCESKIRQMLEAVGWGEESVCHVRLSGGVVHEERGVDDEVELGEELVDDLA